MLNQALGIFKRQRAAWAQAAGLKGLVPALDFSVGLGVVRGGLDMSQASDPDELFEVTGDELLIQKQRTFKIRGLDRVDKAVIEAARQSR